VPPRHPSIAHALGSCLRQLGALRSLTLATAHAPDRRGAAGPGVLVACSGGPDSVALLGLLCLLAPREGWRLAVGHVDHGLRPSSPDEAALVQRLAAEHGLPCEVDRLQLALGPGLPARARHARRAALREQARRQGAAFVALGHTATDQAETMLLHLARGAGLPGLAAMAEHEPWDDGPPGEPPAPGAPEAGREGGWLRPLLALDRAQTRELAERLGLPFVDDPTNHDRTHPRVRMRHELLPALRELNPRVEAALARTAHHARQAEDALQLWVDRELRARRCPPTARGDAPSHATASAPAGARPVTSTPRWSTEGMDLLPTAVRTRIVRRVCHAAGAPADALAARTLASIDDALAHPGPSRAWDLHPCLRLHIANGELWTEDVALLPSAALRARNH
jgi:tRNA(Ile)-lysidine synthase